MNAKKEQRKYKNREKVWVGHYLNSQNTAHWHYDCELLYVENGCIDITVENTAYRINTYQSAFIGSKQIHKMQALTPETVATVVFFDNSLLNDFPEKLRLSSPVLLHDYNLPYLTTLLERNLKNNKPFCEIETACAVKMLMVDIFRNESLTTIQNGPPPRLERLNNLLTDIDSNFQYYTLNAAANFVGMAPAYFSQLFRKLSGMTFTSYLNQVRTEKAVELLHSGEYVSMTEVSSRCGFESIRNFNRIFKQYTGFTPGKLPQDYVFSTEFNRFSDVGKDPTLDECKLIDSSDGK